MSLFETIEIPFIRVGNRSCLTAYQVARDPRLLEFIQRFPSCFDWDEADMVWFFYPDGVP